MFISCEAIIFVFSDYEKMRLAVISKYNFSQLLLQFLSDENTESYLKDRQADNWKDIQQIKLHMDKNTKGYIDGQTIREMECRQLDIQKYLQTDR